MNSPRRLEGSQLASSQRNRSEATTHQFAWVRIVAFESPNQSPRANLFSVNSAWAG
ncbi:hypothetical protein RRSWK_02683 [Rhodopirellula sp. SWK7]|nr:hypothetical protein RRSWK_02683 [Rhodopirellula sp. SWK7]